MSDIPAVLDLWALAGSSPTVTDNAAGLRALVACDPAALHLAERKGAVVGSVIAAWDGWRGSFYRLAVHPDHRRLGIATALVESGERYLRSLGAVRLSAIVDHREQGAMDFWRSVGYACQDHQARLVRELVG